MLVLTTNILNIVNIYAPRCQDWRALFPAQGPCLNAISWLRNKPSLIAHWGRTSKQCTLCRYSIQCIPTFGNRSKISMEISVKLIKLRIKLDLLPMSCLWILLSRHWSRLNFTFSILNIVEYYNSREGSRKNSIHCKLTLPVNICYLLKHVD